jgi:outer membrane immunogenic protein
MVSYQSLLFRGFDMKKFLLAAVMIGAATGFAQAADPPMELPPVVEAPAFDWSGFYIGAHVGGVWGNVASEFDVDPPGPGFTVQPDFGVSGWLAGLQAGANLQKGKFVLGIEGRIAWVSSTGNDGGFAGATDTFDSNWSASALVKVGVAVGSEGRVLPYLIGGVTGLNYDWTKSVVGASSTTNATALGGSVGVGIAFALTEKVSIFGEYLHTFYGTNTVQINASVPAGIPAQRVNVTPTIGTAKVGVNFHF